MAYQLAESTVVWEHVQRLLEDLEGTGANIKKLETARLVKLQKCKEAFAKQTLRIAKDFKPDTST